MMPPESELLYAAETKQTAKPSLDDLEKDFQGHIALKQAAATAETEEELDAIHSKMLRLTEEYKAAANLAGEEEKASELRKFRKGAQVKIVAKDRNYFGRVGTVADQPVNSSSISVLVGYLTYAYSIEDLELVQDPKEYFTELFEKMNEREIAYCKDNQHRWKWKISDDGRYIDMVWNCADHIRAAENIDEKIDFGSYSSGEGLDALLDKIVGKKIKRSVIVDKKWYIELE